jgi:hypothetical protein
MGPRSLGRFLRRARGRLRRIREANAASGLRRDILAAVEAAAATHPSPYFTQFSAAVENTADLSVLHQARRSVQQVGGPAARDPAGAPPVSVIMPVHNRRGVVGEAIRSVLTQSHRGFELLICDDASSDGTAEELQSFRDERIRILAHPHRRGAAAARNTCLGAARGEIIAYLDSDNLWHPRFLEVAVSGLLDWPGHLAAYASFFDLQIDGEGTAVIKDAVVKPFDLEEQIDKPYVDLNSFVHRRELADSFGGFDERLLRRQDYDLIARYAWCREPRHLPYALNLYRRSARLSRSLRCTAGISGRQPSSATRSKLLTGPECRQACRPGCAR